MSRPLLRLLAPAVTGACVLALASTAGATTSRHHLAAHHPAAHHRVAHHPAAHHRAAHHPAAHRPAAGSATAVFPAVAHATVLKVEPLPGVGHSPAPTVLRTRDLVVGHGAKAPAGSIVTIQYVGTAYSTGTAFDSSWSRHAPSTFSLTNVVPGFAKGIVGMRVGGRREIVIPPALGYGASGQPPTIAPNETLVFVVDLLKVTS